MNTTKHNKVIKTLTSCVFTACAVGTVSLPAQAGGKADPLISFLQIDRFERQFSDEHNQSTLLEGNAWLGHDLKKLWLNYEVVYHEGNVEDLELEWLYHQAVSPYWNLQFGLRQNIRPNPVDYSAVIGFEGTAPYFFETETHLSVSDDGIARWSFQLEREWMFSQHWIAITELSGNAYNKTVDEKEIGKGFSDTEFSLRLNYAIRPEIAPYVGINWNNYWGERKDLAKAEGSATSEIVYSIGISLWF